MDWNFYSRRRRKSLESFLEGVRTLEGALRKFKEEGISNPPLDEIKALFLVEEVVQNTPQTTESDPVVEDKVSEEISVQAPTYLSAGSSFLSSKKKNLKKTDETQPPSE